MTPCVLFLFKSLKIRADFEKFADFTGGLNNILTRLKYDTDAIIH